MAIQPRYPLLPWNPDVVPLSYMPSGPSGRVGLVPGVKPFLQDPNNYDPGMGPLLNAAAFEPLSNFEFSNMNGTGGPGQFAYTGTGPRISNLRGPNYKNMDFSLTKNTRIGERVNFQLRFSFFNAFNLASFINNGINNAGSNFAFNNFIDAQGGFGAWNGNVSPPRTIQIAGRLES